MYYSTLRRHLEFYEAPVPSSLYLLTPPYWSLEHTVRGLSHCASLQSTIVLNCTTLHWNAMKCNAMQWNAIHYNALYFNVLPCIALLCSANWPLHTASYTLHPDSTMHLTSQVQQWLCCMHFWPSVLWERKIENRNIYMSTVQVGQYFPTW